MGKFVDLSGQRFGNLTVINRAGTQHGSVTWNCKCDCGKAVIAKSNTLKSGHTKSCGCMKAAILGEARRTHGQSKTRLHSTWQHMKQRCFNPNNEKYKYYGGRGITVCEEWEQYEAFERWAMSNGYKEDLTLDRIDVNGSYCPENCRWVTWKEQQNNKRNNTVITAFGTKHTLSEWEEISGVNRVTIQKRIKENGKTPESAMSK